MGFGTQPVCEAPGNLQIGHVECVPLKISYHLYVLRIPKVLKMLTHRLVGCVHSKKHYLMLRFCFLFIKKFVFLSFSYLFLMNYQIFAK